MTENKKMDHVLLVDDEKHLLVSLRDFLMHNRFKVTTAQSAEEGLRMLETAAPDLIVLDISMPGIGGLGFLRAIAGADGKPRFPVLVLTARSMLADFFRDVPVDGFVAKPCDEDDLVNMIRSILARRRQSAEKHARDRRFVLLAEDDANVAPHLMKALQKAGFDVNLAVTGPELLEKATMLKPDIVVTKEILKQLNGDAVATMLDVMPTTRGIPVVVYDDSKVGDDARERIGRIPNVRQYLTSAGTNAIVDAVVRAAAD
jgi:DNA-binding response OmpR family regulator